MRILDQAPTWSMDLAKLGLRPRGARAVRARSTDVRTARVLVTGPTGSGKSTTLYAALNAAQHGRAEHHHRRGPGRVPAAGDQPGAGQPEGRPDASPPGCARSCGRPRRDHGRRDPRPRRPRRSPSSPRSPGHLVLSTLHTNDAAGGDLAPDRDGHRAVPGRPSAVDWDPRPAARAAAVRALHASRTISRRRSSASSSIRRGCRPGWGTPPRSTGRSGARAAAGPATRAALGRL